MSANPNSAVLHELLNANQYFALNGKGTTNHCPMALIALAKMGASDDRLKAFFTRWQQQFAIEATPVQHEIERRTWQAQIGEIENFAALQACFHDWLREKGVLHVLQQVLPAMQFAPASLAFHAVIRLAYGLEAQHPGEIAAGLAALVVSHLPVPLPVAPPLPDARSALAQLARQMEQPVYPGPSITGQLRAVAADARFTAALAAIPYAPALLDDLARLAIAAYWQTKNFTVLHMVTGMHAVRLVLAQLPPDLVQSLLPPLWSAVAAAYVSVGAPVLEEAAALETMTPAEGEDWATLLAQATQSDNDHVIKFCYICQQENMRQPNALYFASAQRMLVR